MVSRIFPFVIILVLILSACGSTQTTSTVQPTLPPPEASVGTEVQPQLDAQDQPTLEGTAISISPAEPSIPPLPPDPQRVEFQAEDGTVLIGYYYPAAINPAPVIVLMHWGGGDQTDWLYVGMVSWLQNRGAPVPPPPASLQFDTPYQFSALPEDRSFAVFTFDFRGFGESKGNQFENFVMDASAAYITAADLEGVDPARIVGIGGSVGANGAAGGCNENCIAALSFGPQDFGGFNYAETVTAMGLDNKPAWCVAAEDMEVDLETCNSASGDNYFKQIYPLGGHAMMIFNKRLKLEPPIDTVIINFLNQTLP